MAVVNDSAGRKATRLDAKAASRVLQAAQEVNASQFVLVSPSGSSSGGGIFGKLFGGGSGGGSGARLSSLEQASSITSQATGSQVVLLHLS